MMSSYATTAAWNAEAPRGHACRAPRRGWEIAGIILGFIVAWPLALAYLAWKLVGYPLPNEVRVLLERKFGLRFGTGQFASAGVHPTGNSAFEEYRRRELERLEEERRRLDEESRAFAEFVEELKRARDREEFDAFIARRRASSSTA